MEEVQPKAELTLFSFGFKYGKPEGGNYILDVRFLPNPYWEEALKPYTGKDPRVAEYVLENSRGEEFLARIIPLLDYLLKSVAETGKPELNVGIGCTGGHHRSVAVVEYLAKKYRPVAKVTVEHHHIDLE